MPQTLGPGRPNHQWGLIALIRRSRPINLITGPIIYSVIFPLLLLDAFVWVYQYTCFPVYKIGRIDRAQFILFDRQALHYLDWVSKFHCTYCAYAVGVAAFSTAVISATEAYFCPIKHQHKAAAAVAPTVAYIDYEEPIGFDFDQKLESLRQIQERHPSDGTAQPVP